ncbi:MAG: AI-2E family transporter [Pseudomonadota bacterium]
MGGSDREQARPWRQWPPFGYLLSVGVGFLTLWVLFEAAWRVRWLFFLAFLAVLFAAILSIPVGFLARWLPRAFAAVLVIAALISAAIGVFYLSVPLLAAQVARLAQGVPAAIDRLEDFYSRLVGHPALAQLPESQELLSSLSSRVRAGLADLAAGIVPLAFGTLSAVGVAILLVFVTMFLAYSSRDYVKAVIRLVPRGREDAARELLRRLGTTIQHWTLGTLVSMFFVGALTSIGLLIAGIDSWYALGLIMFFAEFVPYVGPIVGAIPGIAVGLAESGTTALYALLVYVTVQELEGHLLTPLVMKRAVSIQPALLLLWQILLASAFGFFAVLVSTPLLACIKVTVDYLYVERMLGKNKSESESESGASQH